MNRRRNNFSKTIKDYLVPLVGLLLIIILAWSIFGGSSDTLQPNTNDGIGLEVTLDGASTEAFIVYEGDYKTQIETSAKLFKGEKVLVKSGVVDVALDDIGEFKLDTLGEFKYNTGGDFTLFSSNLWLNSKAPTDINLQFGNSVKVGANSTVSISQNDVQATVYLLDGTATVYSQTGKYLSLAKGEQITLSRQDSIDKDADLSLLKKNLGEFFKVTDWYIKNNGDYFLNRSMLGEGASTLSGSLVGDGDTMLTSIFDESTVSSSPIKLEGKYDSTNTSLITINGVTASLNPQTNLFKIDQFTLTAKTNDLVIKTYDTNRNIVSKQVYTVYYSGGSDAPAASAITGTLNNDTTIYDIDATKFGFTAPSSSGKFATTGSEITIRGITTATGISKVVVDGFELKSFNGTTWRYHAFTRFDTLRDGTNQYEIKYFGEDGNLVYTDHYTIVKKAPGSNVPAEKVEEVISDEV